MNSNLRALGPHYSQLLIDRDPETDSFIVSATTQGGDKVVLDHFLSIKKAVGCAVILGILIGLPDNQIMVTMAAMYFLNSQKREERA